MVSRSLLRNVLLIPALIALAALVAVPRLPTSQTSRVQGQAPNTDACNRPPAGFDPLTASAADVIYYGFPRRPDGDPTAMANWKHLVENIKVRDCMIPVLGDRISSTIQGANSHSSKAHGVTAYSLQGNSDSYMYDGYEPVAATFYSASADWVVPSYVSVSGYANATDTHWVSVGGDGTNMWQAGIEVDQRNGFRFWNEEVNAENTCCPVDYEGPVISPGNTVSAYVDYCFTYTNPCESYVYVANQTTGHSFSRYVTWTPGVGNTFFFSERSTINKCITPLEEWKETQNPQNLLYSIPWQLAYAGEITGGIHEDQELGLYPYYGYSMTTNGPSGGTLLADHTAVGSDNRSFYTTWHNFGPENPC